MNGIVPVENQPVAFRRSRFEVRQLHRNTQARVSWVRYFPELLSQDLLIGPGGRNSPIWSKSQLRRAKLDETSGVET